MKILLKTLKNIFLLAGFCLFVTPLASLAQSSSTILILPFDVQANAKYDYLKPAIADMIFTRLAAPGRTLVVENREEQPGMSPAETITLADAIRMGQQRGADYIVTGSIILQDDAIRTNADFIGIDEQRALVAFSQEGEKPGDIITQIDNFTAKVNGDILNPGTSNDEQTSQSTVPDDIHQHPEKMAIPETTTERSGWNTPTHNRKSRSNMQPVDNR